MLNLETPTHIHVLPHREVWAVKIEGSDALTTYPTPSAAVAAAKVIANRTHGSIIVHSNGGGILWRDPSGTPGRPARPTHD